MIENTEKRHQMRALLKMIGGKWKLEILWLLNERVHRFGELSREIPQATQHMLTKQLRELESGGFVTRTVYAEVPPRVEYSLTDRARSLGHAIEALVAWVEAQDPVTAEEAGDPVPRESADNSERDE